MIFVKKGPAVFVFFVLVVGVLITGFANAGDWEKVQPEREIASHMKRTSNATWMKVAHVDMDRDGDVDKVIVSDVVQSDRDGLARWYVYMREDGAFWRSRRKGFFDASIVNVRLGTLRERGVERAVLSMGKEPLVYEEAGVVKVLAVWYEKVGELNWQRRRAVVDKDLKRVRAEGGVKDWGESACRALGGCEEYSREEAVKQFVEGK